MLIVLCYFPLVLYIIFHKSSSDVVTLPPVNWDFQQFAKGNFEGILTNSCNNGHGGKDHITRGDTNWLRNTGKVKNNSPNQKFPPSVRKATNLDDTTDKKVHQLFLISVGPRKGAVCLDGSPPGLYLRKGSGSGKSKWTIFFQGGAWCHDAETCYQRSGTALGSSRCYGRYLSKVEGLLSNEAKYNPGFFNWTSVFFPYCDGASFSGNRAKPLKFKKKLLYFRGHRIMDVLLDELLQRGIGNASEIILAGRSAGALSAIIHADYIRSRLRSVTNASFRVLSDAGFFLDEPSLNGSKIARSVFQQMYSLHNSSTGLNQACLRAQKRQYKWRCFFPQYSLPFLSSPIFLVNSLNDLWQLAVFSNIPCVVKVKTCHSKELRFLAKFRKKTLHALRSAFDSRKTAVFADACLAHTQCAMNDYWTQIEVENISIAQAFSDWYREREQNRFMIDPLSYSRNPTCPKRYHWR